MKVIEGFDVVQAVGEDLPKLKPGAYVLRITNVVDVPDREYLEVYVDIVSGEFANYFNKLTTNTGKDYSKNIRSYKQSALNFFKGFITAVEKSNVGYKWDWNEKGLIGKQVVGVYGEEEFQDNEGNIKVNTKIQDYRSIQALNEGKIKVPELKKLKDVGVAVVNNIAIEVNSEDLPF